MATEVKERAGKTSVRIEKVSGGKAGAWVVTSGHDRRTLVVSKESSDRIRETAQRFDGALKRLANR